jgi:excisionase family DNA binding protein
MDNTDFQSRVFSINESAAHLRVSRSFVYSLIAQKKLRLTKLGRRSVVTGKELARLIAAAERAA